MHGKTMGSNKEPLALPQSGAIDVPPLLFLIVPPL